MKEIVMEVFLGIDKTSYKIGLKQCIGIIREANDSGMDKCSWCEQNGISHRQFYYWQRKVRDCAIAQAALAMIGIIAPYFQTDNDDYAIV